MSGCEWNKKVFTVPIARPDWEESWGKVPDFLSWIHRFFTPWRAYAGFQKITRRFLPLHIGRFSNIYRIKFVTQETHFRAWLHTVSAITAFFWTKKCTSLVGNLQNSPKISLILNFLYFIIKLYTISEECGFCQKHFLLNLFEEKLKICKEIRSNFNF